MDATFTPEQEALRLLLRDLAADRATSAQVRAAMAGATGHDPALWDLVRSDLGLTGVGVPEDLGGTGGDFVDVAVVVEECGRALLPVPLPSTLVVAAALRATGPAGADALAALVADAVPAAPAVTDAPVGSADGLRGTAEHVLDGHLAERFLVAAPDGLWLLRRGAPGVEVRPVATLDPTRRQAVLSLDRAAGETVGDAADAAAAVDLLRVALAVEAVGVARRCLDLTVAHLKAREQFGRPIGSFQALQHRAADLVVALESAASAAYYAAWAAACSVAELPVVAPLAKAVCGDAAYRIAAQTIQLHGGIGFTWEHDAHLLFKRATTIRLLLGDSHEHRRLVAQRVGLAGREPVGQRLGTRGPVTPQ